MIIQGQSSHQTRQRPVAPAHPQVGVEPPTILVIIAMRDDGVPKVMHQNGRLEPIPMAAILSLMRSF